MISTKVTISQKLLQRLSDDVIEECAKEIADKVGVDVLEKVQKYGEGTGNGGTAFGGAPHWQGAVTVAGHYRGYLSEQHRLVHASPYHVQIVSDADFVWGVIYGISTNFVTKNGEFVRFPPNPYHKRAVDKVIAEGTIPLRWKSITKGRLR